MVFLLMMVFPYGEVILDIGVKGLHYVDTSIVLTTSNLSIGEILTEKMGQRAIKYLYSTGLFKEIKLEAERKGGGVKVWIVAEEYPRLRSVNFEGNKKIKDKEISPLIDISPPMLVSDRRLFRIKKAILNLYREKGFRGTKVDLKRDYLEGEMDVTFEITEGKKLVLVGVKFWGNEKIKSRTLGGKIKHRGKKKWMFWRKGEIVDSTLVQDVKRIEDYYREKGFLDAKVDSYKINENNSRAVLNFYITEGIKYYVGSIIFVGNEYLKNPEKYIKLKRGDIFNNKSFQRSIQNMYTFYTNNGYLYVNINPDMQFQGDTVNITLSVTEGDKVFVKYIDIKGNEKTYDKVIRRNITIFPGDIFKREEVINSQKNIFRLGYFDDLGLEMKPEQSKDSVTLVFKVKEKQSAQFTAGFGFSGDIGLTGNVSMKIPNFLGRGQQVNFSYERTVANTKTSQPVQNLTLGFREPWLFDTPTSFGFNIFSTYRMWQYYNEYKTGGQISLGKLLTKNRNVFLGGSYSLSRNEITVDTTKSVPDFILNEVGKKIESSVTANFWRDTRDNYLAAKNGSYITFSPKLSGGILQGDVSFYKINFEIRRYEEIFPDFVLMNRLFFGFGNGIGQEIPLTEKYILGGSGPMGIRGYNDRSIGPMKDNYVIGGNAALIINLELRRNLSKTAYVMTFIDAGNAYKSLKYMRLADLYTSGGVGFRVEIPMMGIIGFDFGYGFDKDKGRKWLPHFQLGVTF